MPLSVAVVGCGRMGSRFADDRLVEGIYAHAEAYDACPSTQLVAICDRDRAALDLCGERWHVERRYTDLDALLNEAAPEILSVCTPDETHYAIVKRALEHGTVRAVLAEKPLATTLAGAWELADLAERRGVVVAVNYSRRYSPNIRRLRDLLQQGFIGRIQALSGYYTKGVVHNGTHWFDLVRLLVGDVQRVQGFGNHWRGSSDPTLDVRVTLADGTTGYLHGCDQSAFTLFELDIVGTDGRVQLKDGGHRIVIAHAGNSSRYSNYRELGDVVEWEPGLGDMTLRAVEDVVECLTRGVVPRCTAWDGVAALEIACAAVESARSGKAIDLGGDGSAE